MLSYEEIRLTSKYLNEYSNFCSNRVCGEGCPVFDEHQRRTNDKSCSGGSPSCFKIYCEFREAGKLPAPPSN